MPFERAEAAWRERARKRRERTLERLATVDRALELARRAYLEQRWADMLAAVEQAERDALDVLARPEHCPSLWAVEFTRGLAHRGSVSSGQEAWRSFALAGRLDPTRRPSKSVYGPDVAAAFAKALERAQTRATAVLEVDEASTRTWVDCQDVSGSTLAVGTGLHVVWSGAPGYRIHAERIEVDGGGSRVALERYPDDADPFAVLEASPTSLADTQIGRVWIRRAAARLGASVVVLLDQDPEVSAARLLTAQGTSPVRTDARPRRRFEPPFRASTTRGICCPRLLHHVRWPVRPSATLMRAAWPSVAR